MDPHLLTAIADKKGTIIDGAPRDGCVWIRCSAGHEWCARICNLLRSHSWCPECYGNKPLTIEDMQRVAENRGGKCLSDEYHGLKCDLKWECAFSHQWEATPNNVKNHGSWCPHCRVNVGEELVRTALEEALPGYSFDRTRREPWMEGLELDGYNEELRLAFEYQGIQHYQRVEHFQREEGDFEAQLERDALTVERCTNESVAILDIPHTIAFKDLRSYVRHELEILAYDIAPPNGTDAEFYDRVRARGPSTERQYAHIVEVIKQKGGECLSARYVGYRVPLRIRCGHGHEFEATPEAIDQPSYRGTRFCPECGGTRRREDEELRSLVESCGYQFLSVESREMSGRVRRRIRVICPAGHEYDTMWDNFCPKNGVPKKGCSKCLHDRIGAGKRSDITEWTERNGITPMSEYRSITTQCRWKCSAGHVFIAKFAVLVHKKEPCTECGLAKFAAEKGLELCTAWTKYSGPTTPLNWRCGVCGTVFVASLAALGRKKELCPRCVI